MKVIYGNPQQPSFDVSAIFLPKYQPFGAPTCPDMIFLPADAHERAQCLGVPVIKDATIYVEDDAGNKAHFRAGEVVMLEKIKNTDDCAYKLTNVPLTGAEVPLRVLARRFVNVADRVLEIGADDGGALASDVMAIVGTEAASKCLCMKTTAAAAATAAEALAPQQPAAIVIEGAILSPVPLVKNVHMIKTADPGFDDPDTWFPIDTMMLVDLAAKHPTLFENQTPRFDVLILGANHDKLRPVVADYPAFLARAKTVIVKNNFLMEPLSASIALADQLVAANFERVSSSGACAVVEAHIPYTPTMYQVWQKRA